MTAVLYDYWRSSASYRVRIALAMLGIDYRTVSVDLLAAAHKTPEHLARNPQGKVPVLDIDGHVLTQSLAIIEYLHETRPGSTVLPADPVGRQRVRALSDAIAMDIHPICNTGTINHVMELTSGGNDVRVAWMQKFIGEGLAASGGHRHRRSRRFRQGHAGAAAAPTIAISTCRISTPA
jgi:maleylacetoacetate isomerase